MPVITFLSSISRLTLFSETQRAWIYWQENYLNLNSFSKSKKAYRRADKAGYRLLDHDKNHFKEILDGNLTSSFTSHLKRKENLKEKNDIPNSQRIKESF